jgi:hypothetical protein
MEKIPLKYLFTRYTTAFFIIKLESSGNKLDCGKITPHLNNNENQLVIYAQNRHQCSL